MGIIRYRIVSGVAPFNVELIPSIIPLITHSTTGIFEIEDIPNGSYTLVIKDSNDCIFEKQLSVDPLVTTTTTTEVPNDSIIIGQTSDETLIFNQNATNRDVHYSGYPNENIVNLYLWFKTTNGAPTINDVLINYSITANSGSTFTYNGISDEIHTIVLQNVVGPLTTISGQILLKSGFIETFFNYTYNKDSVEPSFEINLNSNVDWLNTTTPLTSGINVYGVTYLSGDNAILNF